MEKLTRIKKLINLFYDYYKKQIFKIKIFNDLLLFIEWNKNYGTLF